MFPFVIPGLSAPPAGSVVDVAWLNEKPAGKDGFVRVRDGHFVDGSGKRLRFLASNFTFGSCFPDHDTAEQLAARLASLGINCIRFIPNAGIVIDSSRTLSSDTRWWYVGTRRLFNFVKSTLKNDLYWVKQEPNTDTLWKQVKFNVVRPFLMDLWRQGAFGTGTPEQVFTVKCDADNNPPHKVDQGFFKLEVYFYPSKPAETIVIMVGQQDSGTVAKEK